MNSYNLYLKIESESFEAPYWLCIYSPSPEKLHIDNKIALLCPVVIFFNLSAPNVKAWLSLLRNKCQCASRTGYQGGRETTIPFYVFTAGSVHIF